ncbi:hypothetical protein [Paraprevotella clara]|uniref:hypothetical protein n=1 Tax=Paraprevotella clara TaxID=454154 RepID=UPI002491FB9E|nr:hypothetical protein [Paraprevotella clara]
MRNWAIRRHVGFVLCALLISFSCGNKRDFKDELLQMQSRHVILSLDSMDCRNIEKKIMEKQPVLKLVVYSDTLTCSSCRLHEMQKWDPFLKRMKHYKEDINTYFIFRPLAKDMDVFNFTMKAFPPSYPIYVDTTNIFLRMNPQIPDNPIMHTFLLDENNNVLLVGNPLENEKIEEMFWQIVEEKLGKRE